MRTILIPEERRSLIRYLSNLPSMKVRHSFEMRLNSRRRAWRSGIVLRVLPSALDSSECISIRVYVDYKRVQLEMRDLSMTPNSIDSVVDDIDLYVMHILSEVRRFDDAHVDGDRIVATLFDGWSVEWNRFRASLYKEVEPIGDGREFILECVYVSEKCESADNSIWGLLCGIADGTASMKSTARTQFMMSAPPELIDSILTREATATNWFDTPIVVND